MCYKFNCNHAIWHIMVDCSIHYIVRKWLFDCFYSTLFHSVLVTVDLELNLNSALEDDFHVSRFRKEIIFVLSTWT